MRLLLITLIIMFSCVSLAQNVKTGPVKVHANSMQYFGSEFRSTFKGNVVAVGDNFTLTADSVDVYFNDKSDVQRIVCHGNVNFKTKDILAVAANAELNQVNKIINLSGGSKIWQRENYLEGDKVTIHYETKEIAVDKGSNDKVIIIFKPEDNMSLP